MSSPAETPKLTRPHGQPSDKGTVRQWPGQVQISLLSFLHSHKFPMSSSIMVISRHYQNATETKKHIRTNFHLPPPDYKRFHSKVFFLKLDPHFSSSFTPKPRPPQPQLRKIPQVFHSSQPSFPYNLPTALFPKPGLPPNYPSYLTTAPQVPQVTTLLFPLSPAPCPAHPPSKRLLPRHSRAGYPQETEAEEGDGAGRE